MKPSLNHLLLLLAVPSMAMVVPNASWGGLSTPSNPSILTTLITVGPSSPGRSSVHCDAAYCKDGTSYCHFWAGATTWNPTIGPVPGEMQTVLGACGVLAAQPTA